MIAHQVPNLQEIKNNLIDKLRPSGWANKLKGFILSTEFDTILERLWRERELGHRFGPSMKQMFRAFEECPYDELKVIVCGQDPYPGIDKTTVIADGIAFSCSNTGKPQPSLEFIHDAISRTVYPNEPYEGQCDLKYLSNQGILLLNVALSVEINKIGSHYDIWKPFITYLLDILNITHSGLVFWFMGSRAREFESLINDSSHYKFFTEHPNAANYRSNKVWNELDTFNKVNEILQKSNNTSIKW